MVSNDDQLRDRSNGKAFASAVDSNLCQYWSKEMMAGSNGDEASAMREMNLGSMKIFAPSLISVIFFCLTVPTYIAPSPEQTKFALMHLRLYAVTKFLI